MPAGSVLVIRASGQAGSRSHQRRLGGCDPDPMRPRLPRARGTPLRHHASGAAIFALLDEDVTWKFAATPDRAPTIALTKDPESQRAVRCCSPTWSKTIMGLSAHRRAFALKQRNKNRAAVMRSIAAGFSAGSAPIADPQRRRADHERFVRSSMGGCRSGDGAHGARRGGQRRLEYAD